MFVRIMAKSSSKAPRSLIVGQKAIYTIDRTEGYRLTVLDRKDLSVLFNETYPSLDDALNIAKKFETPYSISVITGYGKGKVYVRIKDVLGGKEIKKSGVDTAVVTYIIDTHNVTKTPTKPEKKQPEIKTEPAKEVKTQTFNINNKWILLIIAGVILFFLLRRR